MLCFTLVRPDRRAVAAYPTRQLPRWVASFPRFKQEYGVCLQQRHGRNPPGEGGLLGLAIRALLHLPCCWVHVLLCPLSGVRVSSVWVQGAHCLGPGCPLSGVRVSSVWGQGARCLGSGCPVCGVSAPAVCGQGVQCVGPGRLPCDRLEVLELTPQEHVCPALRGLVGRRGTSRPGRCMSISKGVLGS